LLPKDCISSSPKVCLRSASGGLPGSFCPPPEVYIVSPPEVCISSPLKVRFSSPPMVHHRRFVRVFLSDTGGIHRFTTGGLHQFVTEGLSSVRHRRFARIFLSATGGLHRFITGGLHQFATEGLSSVRHRRFVPALPGTANAVLNPTGARARASEGSSPEPAVNAKVRVEALVRRLYLHLKNIKSVN